MYETAVMDNNIIQNEDNSFIERNEPDAWGNLLKGVKINNE